MLSYLLIICAFLFLIITSSIAQFRYAVTNVFASTSLLLNISIAISIIAVGIFLKIYNNRKSDDIYKITGSKGGKSTKKKNDPQDNKSPYPYP